MKVDREELLDALVSVQPGLSSKDIIIQASNFIFDDDTIYTYNDEIAISCDFKHGLTISVPADKLFKLISKITDVDIDIESTETELLIKGKKVNAVLKGVPPLVPLTDETKPTVWEDVPEGFLSGMQYACMSTSTDMAKPVLTCVHWTKEHIESCDNFRLTRYTVATEALEDSILIPSSSIVALLKYAPSTFCVLGGWAHFKTDNDCIFSCRIFAGEYSNLDTFINIEEGDDVVTFPNITNDVLERVSILSALDVSNSSYAEMKIKDKMLTISGNSKEFGTIKEQTRINCKADIVFSVKIEALGHIIKKFKKGAIAKNKSAIKFSIKNLVHVVSLMEAG